jgi:hypothetical protein
MALANTIGTMTVVNMPGFLKAIVDTPKVQLRYMRGELSRGVKRIRKSFIQKQLHGPPGIKANKLAKGKNVFTFVQGSSLERLGAKIGISRILHVHEKGMTITPKASGLLYLHAKGRGPIFAVASKVVIPARLRFRQQVEAEGPAMLRKVGDAGKRATEQTLSKGLRSALT